ncbi:hypothetical protein D3C80_675600 [compost metagenome]
MSVGKVQYITANDSRLVANSVLDVAGARIPLSIFDFAEFGNEQRKTLVGWAGREEITRYGPAVHSRKISEKKIHVEVLVGGVVVLDLAGEKTTLDAQLLAVGSYVLNVSIYLDVPLKTLGDVPAHIKPLLQYSEIVNVMIRLESARSKGLYEAETKYPVYDGYGQLGFFIADLEKMNDYISSRLGNGRLNLKDAFCETEIASELFDEGLLILVWGMTPWQYYIYGLNGEGDAGLVPHLDNPQFGGKYKLRADITNPSVVSGDFLLNWPDCLSMDFPKISLGGTGESVIVEVHVMSFYIPGVGVGPSLPIITVCRKEEDSIVEPLLMLDIESVDHELGF